jgi:hypothetical protein
MGHGVGRCQNGRMTESAFERDGMADGSGQAASEEEVITRLTRDRREGHDTTQDVRELLILAARTNRAALDRLAE